MGIFPIKYSYMGLHHQGGHEIKIKMGLVGNGKAHDAPRNLVSLIRV